MTELVDDLLDISRASRGEITLNKVALDMKLVVNSALEQVRPLIESREHMLAITVAPAKVHVVGDNKRLIQVVANLLNNAAKYTPPGGEIGVRLYAKDGNVCIEISDNGQGIAPEQQPQIFKMFEQVQRTSDRTSGGLGIGLALVRSITILHGGSVTCHSAGLGQGSRFTVCVPQVWLDEAAPAPERPAPVLDLPVAATSLSVLVVDDNVDAAEMLEFFLQTSGHRLRLAHTAEAGLNAVVAEIPDVCILDIGLPDSTGHELAASIRAHASPAPVLIALTGYSMGRDRNEAAEAGFDHFFVKPADLSQLAAVLSAIAPR